MGNVACAATLLLAACITDLGEDHPPGSHAGEVTGDCLVPLGGRGAPAASLEFAGRGSLWLWEDASALVPGAAAACRGELTVAPAAPVPLLPEEQSPRADGRRVVAVPRGGFVDGETGYLYYDLQLRGPGVFDVAPLGTGLCTLEGPEGLPCERSPSLLWTATPPRGGPGFVDADGLAYVFACSEPAALEHVCTAARVRPAQAGDAAAYELAGAFGGWGPEPGVPAGALAGTDLISVGPYTYLVRDLVGVVIPSSRCDLYLFASADAGNRKGLAVFTEEATLGFGARFAFW